MAGRVLIIDDEPTIRRLLAKVLRKHDVVEAASGQAGLEALREHGPFDVVLCDVRMPEVTGIDVERVLSEECPELLSRVLYMSGGGYEAELQEFLDALPPERRIDKPFPVLEVAARINDLITASQAAQDPPESRPRRSSETPEAPR